jgi:hypothetical protein
VRAFLVGLAFLLSACASGPGSGSQSTPAPATAKGVVLQSGDVPGIQKCPQSDRWAELMLEGQPEMLPTGFAAWSDLKAAGATDGWLSLYAENVSECPLLLSSTSPKGRLVYSLVIQFSNSSSAGASFASDSQGFPVAPSFSDRFVAAGGKVTKGASTGLGGNSAVATITLRGVPTYVAFWQNKGFNAVVYADNLSAADGASAVASMNARIH